MKHQSNKQYLRVADLKKRWNVSTMFVERRTREPDFPKAIRMPGSRIRLFDEEEVQRYEQKAVVTGRREARG